MNIGSTKDYEKLSVLQSSQCCKVFGSCWRGRHRNGGLVAIRVLQINEKEDLQGVLDSAIIHFEKYSSAQGMLGPTVFCADTTKNEIWLIYKYLGGHQNLIERKSKEANEEFIVKTLKQVLLHLGSAHTAGLYHCRLKGSNVLVNNNNDIIMLDHGMAFFERYLKSNLLETAPHWTPPEALSYNGTSMTPHKLQLDIWGVGMLAYDMAAKAPMYEHRDAARSAALIKEQRTVNLYALRGLSSEFRDFVASCLQKDPLARPTCQQLLKDPGFLGKSRVPKLHLGHLGTVREEQRPASARDPYTHYYARVVRPVSQTSSAGPSPREADVRRPPRSPQPEEYPCPSTTPPYDTWSVGTSPSLPRCGSCPSRSPMRLSERERADLDEGLTGTQPPEASGLLKSVISPAVNGVLDDVTAASARQLFDILKEVQDVLHTVDTKWTDASYTFVKELVSNVKSSQVPAVKSLTNLPVGHVPAVPLVSDAGTKTPESMRSYLAHKYSSKCAPLLTHCE